MTGDLFNTPRFPDRRRWSRQLRVVGAVAVMMVLAGLALTVVSLPSYGSLPSGSVGPKRAVSGRDQSQAMHGASPVRPVPAQADGCGGEAASEPVTVEDASQWGHPQQPAQVQPAKVVVIGDVFSGWAAGELLAAMGDDAARTVICGLSVSTVLHSGELERVAAAGPEVLVLAFGSGDLASGSGTAPDPSELSQVQLLPEAALAATDTVACRILVSVDETDRGVNEPDGSMWHAVALAFNDRIGSRNALGGIDHRRHRRVGLVDWAGEVQADPGLVAGFELTAGGARRYAELLVAAIRSWCPSAGGARGGGSEGAGCGDSDCQTKERHQ